MGDATDQGGEDEGAMIILINRRKSMATRLTLEAISALLSGMYS
jgi:hypothetical protein